MSQYQNDSIFWIEVEKVKPNPYQPRHEFDDARLKDLAESIRMYGILQPLVVTRKEVYREDGSFHTEYELISGERRLRASKIAGLAQVPALIRNGEDDARVKLELAIIENLQREDLNAVDRARSFQRLADEFGLKHTQIAEKMGKSREYVSNTLRILALPEEILNALSEGKISEGHTRPLLMLVEHKDEQMTLYKGIMYKKLTVREAESIARKIATDRVRKKEYAVDPEIVELEKRFKETLGTRVQIERKEHGGKIMIDYFSPEDLRAILDLVSSSSRKIETTSLERFESKLTGSTPLEQVKQAHAPAHMGATGTMGATPIASVVAGVTPEAETPLDDRSKQERTADETDENLYSISNFTI